MCFEELSFIYIDSLLHDKENSRAIPEKSVINKDESLNELILLALLSNFSFLEEYLDLK
tara:strand:+ start:278 stop:454 length:177 start_codon:yes stop_codon:yes gene_type:complete